MKKLFAIISVLVLIFALASCGEQGNENDVTTAPDVDQVVDEAPEVTEPVATEPVVTEPVETDPPETQHVHAYKDTVEAATCTRQGKITSVCDCGDTKVDVIPMLKHTSSAVSCEKDTVCTACGTVIAPKTGHKMVSKNVITAATCSTSGKEKATCSLCNYTTEQEIPTTGHVLAANGDISAYGDGYIIKCETCEQKVIVKAGDPLFKLTFDASVVDEAAGNVLGLEIVKPDSWATKDFDGNKGLYLNGSALYINVPNADTLANLGTFMVSFDYMSTAEGADTDKASIISFLGNCYNGSKTDKGSIGWGWAIKLVEADDAISTNTTCDSSNSVSIQRNKKYEVKLIVVPTAKVIHVYIDGTYIGTTVNSGGLPVISKMGEKNLCIRFGDGPKCGHVIDNFVICDIK